MNYRITVAITAEIETEKEARDRCERVFHPLCILYAQYRDPRYCEIAMQQELAVDSEESAAAQFLHFLGHVSATWECAITMDCDRMIQAVCRDVQRDGKLHCDACLIRFAD